jgi:hypothetical protein
MKVLVGLVLGWPPEQNRSIPNYMESSNPYPVRPSAKLLTDCNILVVVHTRTDGFAARMGIRNSWGKFNEAPNNVSKMSIIYLVSNSITRLVNVRQKKITSLNLCPTHW